MDELVNRLYSLPNFGVLTRIISLHPKSIKAKNNAFHFHWAFDFYGNLKSSKLNTRYEYALLNL